MCREAAERSRPGNMGLPFSRTADGRIDQRRFAGHSSPTGRPRSGAAATLRPHRPARPADALPAVPAPGIEFYDEYYALDLLLGTGPDAPAAGVVAYQLATGDLHVFAAKSVVLATGGLGKAFATTSNAHTLTGDGMALAYRRGLPLEDLEFFQFHPTGLHGRGIPLTEAARAEGAVLRNGEGEAFMERYAPALRDLAPPDVVAGAIDSEAAPGPGLRAGRRPRRSRPLHLSRKRISTPGSRSHRVRRTYLGFDPAATPLPVYPTAHYAMGGVPTTSTAGSGAPLTG